MLWLCTDFPQLPVEVFSRTQAEPGPLVVVDQRLVYRHSEACRRHGIRDGLSLATARALCAGLRAVERDRQQERDDLQLLADSALRFTPMASIVLPSSLLLEISGSIRLFHGLETLLRQVQADLGGRGFSMHYALAPTAEAARLLAKAGAGKDWRHYCDPDSGQIDHGFFRQRLGALPLSLLELDKRQQQQVYHTGLKQLSELLALPDTAIGRRFGKDFLMRLERIRGSRPDPRRPVQAADHFQSVLQFPDGVSELTMLRFPMHRLLRELSSFLRRRQAWCQGLSWRFVQNDRQEQTVELRCYSPAHDSDSLLQLSLLRCEQLSLGAPVESIMLSCHDYAALEPRDAPLFPELASSAKDASARDGLLLDRLYARIGRDRVYALRCADEHLPEKAWCRSNADDKGKSFEVPLGDQVAPRPIWLLSRPRPLQRRQRCLYWDGNITLLNGPERIEGPWQERASARDYFIGRHENGSLFWIYRDAADGSWFLHGLFA